jgi:hypothetical protein
MHASVELVWAPVVAGPGHGDGAGHARGALGRSCVLSRNTSPDPRAPARVPCQSG